MQVDLIHFLSVLSAIIGVLLMALMFGAAIVSTKEHEFRAASRIALLGALLSLPYLVVGFIPFPNQEIAATFLLITAALAVAILLVPVGQKKITEDHTPKIRVDERDIMFARAHLTPGSERFDEYYRHNPDKKALDDKFRARPGLLLIRPCSRPLKLVLKPLARFKASSTRSLLRIACTQILRE